MTLTVETLETLNHTLALAGLFTLVVGAWLAIDMRKGRNCGDLIRSWGLSIAFGITALAVILTLVYSELFGITPCGLCWFERMALYPQLILIGVGLYYKDAFMPRSGIALSIFGFLVSIYHHYIQMGGTEFIACPTSGADCAKRFMFEYGFMTFPLLSAILFAFLIVLYAYVLRMRCADTKGC